MSISHQALGKKTMKILTRQWTANLKTWSRLKLWDLKLSTHSMLATATQTVTEMTLVTQITHKMHKQVKQKVSTMF